MLGYGSCWRVDLKGSIIIKRERERERGTNGPTRKGPEAQGSKPTCLVSTAVPC